MGHYQRLSALDASFLAIEDANSHMHVASTLVFDGTPLRAPHGGLDMERIRGYIASRLHLVPRYRQRLDYIPLLQHPVWVDDPRFNIFYHVRHTALPPPGEERQLKRLCGRILSQKLDVTKPLWEIWIVEGLSDGRFALVAKVHHSMVDGVAGVDLLTAMLSPAADEGISDAPSWRPRPASSPFELLADEVLRRARAPFQVTWEAARALGDPRRALRSIRDAAQGLVETLGGAATPASPTPLNTEIGPHRRFDWLRLDLATVKSVKDVLGGTVNDVVLATVVGAARCFLAQRGLRSDGLDFRALVPMNVRVPAEHGQFGNHVAQLLARLPIGESDPRRRYEEVVALTTELKHSHQALGSEIFEEIGEWTATGLLAALMRFGIRRRAYNIVVTNVPGPQIPLYLLGARLLESYPMVPLFANQAVGIALFSYAGGLFWGLNSDWDAIPDLHDFVLALHEEFETFLGLAGRAATAVRAPSTSARPIEAGRERRGINVDP